MYSVCFQLANFLNGQPQKGDIYEYIVLRNEILTA